MHWNPPAGARPTTVANINKYFDRCVEWMVSCASDDAPTPVLNTACDADVSMQGSFVHIEESKMPHPCLICGEMTADRTIGNPFCRSFVVYCCRTCHDETPRR